MASFREHDNEISGSISDRLQTFQGRLCNAPFSFPLVISHLFVTNILLKHPSSFTVQSRTVPNESVHIK
jgi:hypothetical protein